jgi:hypothetical protein
MTATRAMLDAALDYASRGVAVFPLWGIRNGRCGCGAAGCQNAGKHPHRNAPHGFKDATTDTATITRWWTEDPTANIGTPTGAWCAVVDIDPRHGGDDVLDQLERTHSPLPHTPEVLTGGGGRHLYFQPVAGLTNSSGKVGEGIDIRANGGYVLLPPSSHISGRDYADELLAPLFDTALAPMPSWLRDRATANGHAPGASSTFAVPATIRDGTRNETLYKLARSLKAKGLSLGAVSGALEAENISRCVPPMPADEVLKILEHAWTQPDRPEFAAKPAPVTSPEPTHAVAVVNPTDWSKYLYDAAEVEAWDFPPVQALVESLVPLLGVVWWGGMPKRFKSLLLLYLCLAVHCGQDIVAGRFRIVARPRMLYIAREDGGSRLKGRIADICKPWGRYPEPGGIRFMIRPAIDLMDQTTIDQLAALCVAEDRHVLVLDTWTALSPSADPMAAKDQAVLAASVIRLAEMIQGLVIVVDHSRKNRPDGQAMSSADIHGPYVKWASAEHIVMLDTVAEKPVKRIEVFIEGKDVDTDRLFLTVSARESGEEKFAFAGSAADLAEARQAVGSKNRLAVLAVLQKTPDALTTMEVVERLLKAGTPLAKSTTLTHLNALIREGRAKTTGELKDTRYFALELASGQPSWTQTRDDA